MNHVKMYTLDRQIKTINRKIAQLKDAKKIEQLDKEQQALILAYVAASKEEEEIKS